MPATARRPWAAPLRLTLALIAAMLASLTAAPPGTAAPPARPDAPVGKISSTLLAGLADQGEAAFWVRFAEQADLSAASTATDWARRGQAVYDALTTAAAASQADARAVLTAADARYTPFWASNAIYVHSGSAELARLLAADAEVSALLPATTYQLPEPAKADARQQIDSVEWGVAAINADDVWSQFGADGNGIVVGSIDTGVQFTHPALLGQYRGNTGTGFVHDYNWHDPSNVCAAPEPCDNHSHGTHTTGTIVGDDHAGNQIGVAPGARWIAAKGCESGSCSDFALLSAGQWMVAPTDLSGQHPRPDLRPNLVNNSWGGDSDHPWYDDVLSAWRAAGIFPVFSNGNSGPACNTANSPGDRPLAYGVGAVDADGAVAGFSSRGPGLGEEIRPNVSAPGVAVRSSVPGNGYTAYSGTSMAAPHVAGAVALLWSAAPELIGDLAATEALLDQNAVDVDDTTCGGTAADNNVYGEGRLDALAAVSAAPRGPTGTLRGTITAAGAPLDGALVTVADGRITRTAHSGTDGTYAVELPPGDYTVTAAKFGYGGASGTGTVTADQSTTVDLALQPQPTYLVQGSVTEDGGGEPVPGVTVALAGTPLSATTDARGRYRLPGVPAGDYQISAVPAEADNCFVSTEQRLSVRRDTTAPLRLGHATEPYGYTCGYEAARYVEATDQLAFDGEHWAQLRLPFTIDLFHRSYSGGQAWAGADGRVWFVEAGTPNSDLRVAAGAAPFYDGYLRTTPATKIATRTAGRAPNRTFTVEWRDMGHSLDPRFSADFEVTFHENREIVFAYRDIDADIPLERGANAWAWINGPYQSLNRRFLFSSDQEQTLDNERQIRFTLPPSAVITGTVTDDNDGRPIAGAPIRIDDADGNRVLHHLATDDRGRYRATLFPGDYTITALAHGYTPRTTELRVRRPGRVHVVDAELDTAVIGTRPDDVSIRVDHRGDGRTDLTLTNRGDADLTWRTAEQDGAPPPATPGEELGRWATSSFVPGGITQVPGGHVWVTGIDWVDGLPTVIREYRPDGTPTGAVIDPVTDWGLPPRTWLYDLTYVPTTGQVCVADGGADGRIHCFDPASRQLTRTITYGPRPHSTIGLAYDQARDVFYLTGDAAEPIYTGGLSIVAGPGHPEPGAVLGGCQLDMQAAGAAYNPASDTLWVSADNDPYRELAGFEVHQLDPRTCVSVTSFPSPTWSLGLEFDASGALWKTGGSIGDYWGIIRYASGDPMASDIPWLSASRSAGTLRAHRSTTITLRADDAPRHTTAALRLFGNAGRGWQTTIPVTTRPRNHHPWNHAA